MGFRATGHRGAVVPLGTAAGQLLVWNGTAWVATLTRGLTAWQFGATSVTLNPAYLPQYPYVGNGQASADLTKYPVFYNGGRLLGLSCKIGVVGVSQATSEIYLDGVATGLTCVLAAGAFRMQTWAAAPIVVAAGVHYIEVRVSHTGALVGLQYFNATVYAEETSLA